MRCLLAADLDLPSAGLRRVMRRLEVDLVEVDRLGVDWLTESPTPTVDFVCAVLREHDNRDTEAAVLVDIGVALGRRIPVFLVVEPRRKTPLVVAGLTRVEADLNNEEALELHVGQFLRVIRRATPGVQSKEDQSPALSHDEAELAHARLRALQPAGGTGARVASDRFERLMLDLLDTRDAEISAVRESADLGHDLALWAQDASPVLDGPVLVQLKLWSALSSHTLKAAVNAFAEQLNRQPVPFGLLVYHSTSGDRHGPVSVEPKQARVVAVSAHEVSIHG
jgi:hypothetical protein